MDALDPSAVRFEVLGPLRAWRGEEGLRLGPVQQRVVLAVLLLRANRRLGREQLIDAVWGAQAPAYAVNLLQKHVSGLRRVLEPDRSAREPSRLLAWTDAGYLLSVPAGQVDLGVFDREIDRAHAARAAGDLPGAAQALHAALRWWRGPPCDGLLSPLLDSERDRLAERWLTVVEEGLEVDLALGAHADLVAELRQLVVEHPLRERLRGLLMLALYRSGRQGEALAAFHGARRHLRAELGIEPGAELQRLHQQILAADAGLAAPEATGRVVLDAAPEAVHELPAPAQLPHGMTDFTGREAQLDRLHALVTGHGGGTSGAVLITAVAGTAGVGKTALAVH